MRFAFLCSALLAASMPLLAESLLPGVNLDDPATLVSSQTCEAECAAVFADCRVECDETTARAHEEHFDIPDEPVGECLQNCQRDLAGCKRTCVN